MSKPDVVIIKDILKLCVEIYAHSQADYYITLAGNDTNSSEAKNVADELMDILEVPYSDIEDLVETRTIELQNF